MSIITRTKTCFHLLTCAWVIIWVTTVPLFHTHLPDVNDALAPRQGLAHTVFSPDLPGEFSCTHNNVLHLSTKAQNSPELGFAISTDSPETSFEGPNALYIYSWCESAKPLLADHVLKSHDPPSKPDRSRAPQSPRAPPVIVS